MTCTASEFIASNGRAGTTTQFWIIQRAKEWAVKADIWANDTYVLTGEFMARDYAVMAAQLAFIAFADLRDR